MLCIDNLPLLNCARFFTCFNHVKRSTGVAHISFIKAYAALFASISLLLWQTWASRNNKGSRLKYNFSALTRLMHSTALFPCPSSSIMLIMLPWKGKSLFFPGRKKFRSVPSFRKRTSLSSLEREPPSAMVVDMESAAC